MGPQVGAWARGLLCGVWYMMSGHCEHTDAEGKTPEVELYHDGYPVPRRRLPCQHEGCPKKSVVGWCQLHRPKCGYILKTGEPCPFPTTKYDRCYRHVQATMDRRNELRAIRRRERQEAAEIIPE